MTEYLDFQIETDPEVIAQLGFDEMQARIPGWDPIPGELDTALIQANARIAAQVRASAGIVPISVFRYIATQFGLTPSLGQAAVGVASIASYDNVGNHLIPAGTQFTSTAPSTGQDLTWQTTADALIPLGFNSIAGVPIVCLTPGVVGNGILTSGSPAAPGLYPVDALGFISVAVFFPTATYGGFDGDTDAQFFQRILRRFSLQASAPILPIDFAILAVDSAAPGTRAIAIDGYDAVATTSGNARTVTIFTIDASGALLSPTAKSDILAIVQARREINWNIYVADPVLFQVSVKFTAHAIPGYLAADVQAAAIAALTAYLSPATWGTPAVSTLTNWTLLEGWDKVRLGELYEVLNNVDGVAYIDTLNLKAGAVAPTTEVADVTLTGGPVVLATPGSVTGTVT